MKTRVVLTAVVLWCFAGARLPLAVAGEEVAVAEIDQAAAKADARRLVEFLDNRGFYALRDPKEREAIRHLPEVAEQAAPLLGEMLSRGLQNRKRGWIEVYRPLYLLKETGAEARVALPDVVRALEDDHPINVSAAADVLRAIGPDARDSVPALRKAWDRKHTTGRDAKNRAVGKALKALDPEAAREAGVE